MKIHPKKTIIKDPGFTRKFTQGSCHALADILHFKLSEHYPCRLLLCHDIRCIHSLVEVTVGDKNWYLDGNGVHESLKEAVTALGGPDSDEHHFLMDKLRREGRSSLAKVLEGRSPRDQYERMADDLYFESINTDNDVKFHDLVRLTPFYREAVMECDSDEVEDVFFERQLSEFNRYLSLTELLKKKEKRLENSSLSL